MVDARQLSMFFLQAYPCLTTEDAHSYVMRMRAQKNCKLSGPQPINRLYIEQQTCENHKTGAV